MVTNNEGGVQFGNRCAKKTASYPETEGDKLAYIRRYPQDYRADLDEIIEELREKSQETDEVSE